MPKKAKLTPEAARKALKNKRNGMLRITFKIYFFNLSPIDVRICMG